MKYQFRTIPPNADIILDRAGHGYEAGSEELAWFALSRELDQHDRTIANLKSRYTVEAFVPTLVVAL